jgi:hypothetical protein
VCPAKGEQGQVRARAHTDGILHACMCVCPRAPSLLFSPQRIQYAKTESDAVSKLKGTFKLDKKKRAEKNAAARGARFHF